jgi:hypothetical protein
MDLLTFVALLWTFTVQNCETAPCADAAGYGKPVAGMPPAFSEQAPGDSSATAARIVVLEPLAGQEQAFEAGYRRHLEWHRAAGDPWRWYGWQIVSGDRAGFFMDGTFGHPWRAFDEAVQPAADAADNFKNVFPHAKLRSNAYWRLRPELGSATLLEQGMPSAFVEAVYVRAKAGRQQEVEDAVRRLRAARAVYELVSGGRLPTYLLMRPLSTLAQLEGVADAALMSLVADAAVDDVRSELLRYRPDLSYLGRR